MYSTQVEVYIPAIGCLTALLAILVIRRNANLTILRTVGISLLLAMAVLYQQSAVLFCIPLAYYLVATQGRQGWKPLAAILSIAGAIVLSTYIIVFVSISEDRTLGGFLGFCLSYFDNPGWGTFKHFSISGVRALLYAQAVNIVSIPYTVGAAIFGISLAVLSVWNIVQIVKHAVHDKLRSFLLLWLITHFIYFLWWIPWPEHFILTLIPLLLLAFITLEDIAQKFIHSDQGQRVATAVIAILVIVFIFAENFQVVLPSHQTRGQWYDKASELASIAPQECLIGTDWWAQQNLSYYFDITKHFEAYSCLKHFYRNEPPHELPYYEYGECIVIPWSRVTPELTLELVFGQFDGYSHPSEWLAFIEWLFNFEYDSQHRLVACNRFEVIAGDEDIYILITSDRTEMDGLQRLFQMLDDEIAEASGEQTNTLQSWLSTAYLE